MYLNHFCLVLVLVTVSATYFDEDLALYLSDDILISQLPRISKRSILEDVKLAKRDITAEDKTGQPLEKKEGEKKDKSEVQKEEESGLVFIPSFGRRTRRSVPKIDKDLLSSESNIVFLPSFRRNGFRRTRRDTYSQYTKRSVATRNENDKTTGTQSATANKNEELSDGDVVNGQESGLVFLPSFGRRSKRSVEGEQHLPSTQENLKNETPTTKNEDDKNNQEKIEPQTSTTKTKREVTNENSDKEKTKTDDFEVDKDDELEEESGLVFIPSFGRRQRRDTSSVNPLSEAQKESNVAISQKDENQTKKTFDTQESGLVFLPSFNRRSRRYLEDNNHKYIKRSAEIPNEDDKREKSVSAATERNEELSDSDVVNGDESGLVFLPSFGRRSRRNVEQEEHLSSAQKNIKDDTPTTTNNNQEKIESKESTIKTKREVAYDNLEREKSKTDNFNVDKDDELEGESGLVFIPSFGRRQRRDISSVNQPGKSKEDSKVGTQQEEEKQTKKTFDIQESGLVFLPSFNRRTRRGIPSQEHKQSKEKLER